MKHRKLLKLMSDFINDDVNEKKAETFCNEFMDDYYNFQDDLEHELMQDICEMFDDVNVVCDSYEPNAEIRNMDRYCINEIVLRDKVVEIYKKIMQLMP